MLLKNPVIREAELESTSLKHQTAASFSPNASLLDVFVAYQFCMFCSDFRTRLRTSWTISHFK